MSILWPYSTLQPGLTLRTDCAQYYGSLVFVQQLAYWANVNQYCFIDAFCHYHLALHFTRVKRFLSSKFT